MRPQRWLRDNFFAGLAIVLPVALSIFLFTWGLEKITGGLSEFVTRRWLGVVSGQQDGLSDAAKFSIRVGVLALLIVVTIFIGWLARNIIGRHLIKFGDMILERIPLFNRIYVVLRQISQSVLSEKSEMFSEVVLVEFPRPGLRSLGFITSRTKGEIQHKTEGEVYTLFVPTAPNPTSGFMIIATEDQFERLDMSVEEGMKMVISGGAVLPEPRKLVGRKKPAAPRSEPAREAAAPPDEHSEA
jgi:uncharacterized membrane protein